MELNGWKSEMPVERTEGSSSLLLVATFVVSMIAGATTCLVSHRAEKATIAVALPSDQPQTASLAHVQSKENQTKDIQIEKPVEPATPANPIAEEPQAVQNPIDIPQPVAIEKPENHVKEPVDYATNFYTATGKPIYQGDDGNYYYYLSSNGKRTQWTLPYFYNGNGRITNGGNPQGSRPASNRSYSTTVSKPVSKPSSQASSPQPASNSQPGFLDTMPDRMSRYRRLHARLF